MSIQCWVSKSLIIIVMLAFLTGCSTPGANDVVPTIPEATETIVVPTMTNTNTPEPPTATFTLPPATATLTASPTSTPLSANDLIATLTAMPTSSPTTEPTGIPTATKSATPVPGSGLPGAVENSVRIYFIQPNTGGQICGDSLVSIGTSIPRTGDIAPDVKAALNLLFSYKSKFVGNLYNPGHNANLKVSRVSYKSGLITVNLVGTVQNTKDKCENTRLKSQIWSTIKQFRAITTTNIYLNGVPFGDFISND